MGNADHVRRGDNHSRAICAISPKRDRPIATDHAIGLTQIRRIMRDHQSPMDLSRNHQWSVTDVHPGKRPALRRITLVTIGCS